MRQVPGPKGATELKPPVNRERIPEGIVYPEGAGAFGVCERTAEMGGALAVWVQLRRRSRTREARAKKYGT